MKNAPSQHGFAVSEKIYALLLRAYPKAHREAYGRLMAQLFRDQCRDAYGEAGAFGLIKLWPCVLLDWARTSVIERLAALNKRKTMKDKIADIGAISPTPGGVFIRVFVTVCLLVVMVSTTITFMLPESYASRATIKIEQDTQSDGNAAPYDPYFIQTQFEMITSQAVLDPVIQKLHLNQAWGKKYNAGQQLKTAQSLDIIKNRLSVSPVRNTKLANITVYSDDSKEAAQIANAIAESYREYRVQNSGWKNELAQPVLVQITDQAEPGKFPVKPNKTLNIALGVVGGMLVASVLGGIAAWIASIMRRRRQKANAAV